MKAVARVISVAAVLILGGIVSPAIAQDWSALPGGRASTDNNFYSGTPSSSLPVARHFTPGGSITFNAFHTGYIAVVCNVTNPRDFNQSPGWNQLQVTYRDPDGLQGLQGAGLEYQAYVELVRVSKITGVASVIAKYDSNLLCAGDTESCHGSNDVKNIVVPFSHNFDFENYAYAVYGRLYLGVSIFGLKPALYQVRLQSQ